MTATTRAIAALLVLAALGVAAVLGFDDPPPARDVHEAAPQAPGTPSKTPAVASLFAPAAPVVRAAGSVSAAPLPDGPFGTTTIELERRADLGDAQAAARLAAGYRRCRFVEQNLGAAEVERRSLDHTASRLEITDQWRSRIAAQAKEQGVEVDLPKVDPVAAYQSELASQKAEQSDCAGVDSDKAQAWLDWYGRAAMLGDPDAEIGYWHAAFDKAGIADLDSIAQRKDIATMALRHALGRGDARALAAIGELLAQGYLDEPDPGAAYAYLYAASLAPVRPIETLPWIDRGFAGDDIGAWFSRRLAELARTLDPGRIADAERAGADLYARCCAGAGT